jgi:hypothetical protein
MTTSHQIRSAGGQIGRVCSLLEWPTPDALDSCSTVLETVAERLTAIQPSLPELSGTPEALVEAWRLRRAIQRAAGLLAGAAEYHRDWQDLVGVLESGYGPGGRPAESSRPNRMSVRG